MLTENCPGVSSLVSRSRALCSCPTHHHAVIYITHARAGLWWQRIWQVKTKQGPKSNSMSLCVTGVPLLKKFGVCVCACICVCMYVCLYVCLCACVSVCICMYVSICMCVCLCVCAYMCVCICMCLYVCAHVHAYTCTLACAR